MNVIIQGLFFDKMFGLVSYSLSEQRGIVVLLVLMGLSICMRFWPWVHNTQVELHLTAIDTTTNSTGELTVSQTKQTRQWKLESFDINYATALELRRKGFSNRFIGKWFSKKQEVGFVRSVEQFRNLELLSTTEYNLVAPYLDFTRYKVKLSQQKKKPQARLVVNLNHADSVTLKKLPGIGKTLSKRIVKYRNALGGFATVEQLKEVYGISDSLYKRLLPYIDFVADLELLEINANTVVELKRHPYISYRQAKSIVSYRMMHGPFNHVGDLQKIHNLDSNWLNKVEPYLSFD